MSAAPKKMVRTQAKKAGRLAPWVSGPGPILFGVAAVACFAVAVALNLASDSPRKPDAAIAVVAADAKPPPPQNPGEKAELLPAPAAPPSEAKKIAAPPQEPQPAT